MSNPICSCGDFIINNNNAMCGICASYLEDEKEIWKKGVVELLKTTSHISMSGRQWNNNIKLAMKSVFGESVNLNEVIDSFEKNQNE